MENKIMMPASYNVLSCEEMTYTEAVLPSVRLSLHGCGPATLRLSASTPDREARKKDHDNMGIQRLERYQSRLQGQCDQHLLPCRHDLLECCIDHQQLWPFCVMSLGIIYF